MPLDISRNFDVALRMLRENPAILMPGFASLLVSTSVIALSIGLFLYSAGEPASGLYQAVLSNLPLAFFIFSVDLLLIVGVSAYFDSISLYMVRQVWRSGSLDMDDCFASGGRYAVPLVFVDLVFFALMLLFGAGFLLPLFLAGSSPVFAFVSIFSLFFLVFSMLSLYWRREAVVLKGRASGALLFSQGFFAGNVSGTVLLIIFLFLAGFTLEFFGDSMAQLLAALFGYAGVPGFWGDAAALSLAFLSNLLYGVVSRVTKLCVFLDANRHGQP